MANRICWPKLFSLAALLSLGPTTMAQAATPAVNPRVPGTYSGVLPRNAAPNPLRAEFEGPNATDYFNFAQTDNTLANPEIAVGPEDILMVVNKQIFRVPNGNAAGVAAATLNPLFTGSTVAQKAFLDNWIGETALNQLCPTGSNGNGAPATPGISRSPLTCVIDNASVTYDQMHGHFLVLFTITDTGLIPDASATNYLLTRNRKASWVLLISRFAALTDTTAFDAAGNPLPPNAPGTQVFTTPVPGNLANTSPAWAIYYGNAFDSNASDGFGGSLPGPGAVSFGNINNINAQNMLGSANTPASSFDCTAGGVVPPGTIPQTVCYYPTSARLGLDNDSIIITSAVVNMNINPADLHGSYNPVPGPAFSLTAYAGTRVRVIKKIAAYTFTRLTAADPYTGTFAARAAGTVYDLFSSPNADGSPVVNTPAGLAIPFTLIVNNAPSGNSSSLSDLTNPANPTRNSPMFCEPQHLRGRAMASFSNAQVVSSASSPVGSGQLMSQSYLLCAISSDVPGNTLYVQGIRFNYGAALSVRGPLPFYPILQSGSAASLSVNLAQSGFPTEEAVNTFANPFRVSQRLTRMGVGAPLLFVGDNRPQKVVFREGHLYGARVGGPAAPIVLDATTFYDVTEKRNAILPANEVFQWPNRNAWAPMFDAPANINVPGQGSPLFAPNHLEKLFAALNYPPLYSPDPAFAGDPDGDPRSRQDQSTPGAVPQGQIDAAGNCYQTGPGKPLDGQTDGQTAWAGLSDMRCGSDVSDERPNVRDPVTGAMNRVFAYTLRGSSSLDPNDGSLWNFGAYARSRGTSPGAPAHWGTFAANFKLSIPGVTTPAVDANGNPLQPYSDLTDANGSFIPETPYILMAANVGLAPTSGASTSADTTLLPFNGVNSVLYPVVPAGVTPPGNPPAPGSFGPNDPITRREMAAWIVKSQMDEAAITDYLAATGNLNGTSSGVNASSFADVPPADPGYRYIEVMARRGYTLGCSAGAIVRYCPDWISTRRDLAAFIIRAKFSNVFNSLLFPCSFGFVAGTTAPGGIFPPLITTNCGTTGDNFGLFVTGLPYFTDNPAIAGNDWYVFIQKLRELRITNGTFLGPNNDGRNGLYSIGALSGPGQFGDLGNLLRKQMAVFAMRAFFF